MKKLNGEQNSHRAIKLPRTRIKHPISVICDHPCPVRGRPAEGTATAALGRPTSNGVNIKSVSMLNIYAL